MSEAAKKLGESPAFAGSISTREGEYGWASAGMDIRTWLAGQALAADYLGKAAVTAADQVLEELTKEANQNPCPYCDGTGKAAV